MDLDTLRSIVTVLSFATFIGIVFWAYSGRRKASFDQAAQSVFNEDDGEEKARGGSVKVVGAGIGTGNLACPLSLRRIRVWLPGYTQEPHG